MSCALTCSNVIYGSGSVVFGFVGFFLCVCPHEWISKYSVPSRHNFQVTRWHFWSTAHPMAECFVLSVFLKKKKKQANDALYFFEYYKVWASLTRLPCVEEVVCLTRTSPLQQARLAHCKLVLIVKSMLRWRPVHELKMDLALFFYFYFFLQISFY